MSSVKRSNLASSEHCQSKAPDKWETSSSSKTISNALATNTTSDTSTSDTMSSSLLSAAKTSQTTQPAPQSHSRDAQKSANATQQQPPPSQSQQQQQQVTKVCYMTNEHEIALKSVEVIAFVFSFSRNEIDHMCH